MQSDLVLTVLDDTNFSFKNELVEECLDDPDNRSDYHKNNCKSEQWWKDRTGNCKKAPLPEWNRISICISQFSPTYSNCFSD